MSGIRLTIVKGEQRDQGRVLTLEVGHCVMVGRAADVSRHTGMITKHSLSRLDDEDTLALSRHLAGRTDRYDGARALLESFDRDDDVGLNDDAVSTQHAMLFCDEAGLTLLDMGSTNGTFVNGHRVTTAELMPGDLLRIGESRFELKAAQR